MNFIKKIVLLVTFLVFHFFGLAQLSGIYTVGGISPNYSTFTSAVADMAIQGVSGPTIFNIRDGSYQESVLINNIPGISSQNSVTFQSESGDSSAVVLWNNSSSPVNYILRIENLHDITVRGITVKDEGVGSGNVIYVVNGYNFTIENNYIKGKSGSTSAASTSGLMISGSASGRTNIVIRYNLIVGGKTTCGVSSTSNIYVKNVVIEHNTIYGGGVNGHIYLERVENPRVKYNTIYGGRKSMYVIHCSGYDIGYNRFQSQIGSGSRVCDLWSNGNLWYPLRFYNNTMDVVGTGSSGVFGVISLQSTRGVELMFNTIRYESPDQADAILILDGADSVRLFNNNFVKITGGACIKYWFSGGTISQSDYNNFYSDGVISGTLTTLSDWQTAKNLDLNSFSVNPNFVAITADSLIPQNPAILHNGIPISWISDDVFENWRNVYTPTIGAFEIPSMPDVDLGMDTAFCDYGLLDAGNPGASFNWSTGDTTQTITISNSGVYWVNTSDTLGTGVDTINVVVNSLPSLNLIDSVFFCNGDSITLDAGNAGMNFTWNTSDTTQILSINSGGTYFVSIESNNGCLVIDSTVVEEYLANNQLILVNDTLISNITGASYQWIDCNTGNYIGDTNQYFVPTNTGNYSVEVSQNGCIDTTNCFNVVITNIEKNQDIIVKLFPNPNFGLLNLDVGINKTKISIEIFDLNGRLVYHKSILKQKELLDISELNKGIYLLKIIQGHKSEYVKIIKE